MLSANSKENCLKAINRQLVKDMRDQELLGQRMEWLSNSFDMNSSMSLGLLTMKGSLEDESDFVIFAIATVTKVDVSNYFTKDEIEEYRNKKVNSGHSKVRFPIRIPMIEVVPDTQYIGIGSLQMLMKYRNAQLIRYNPETQRTETFVNDRNGGHYKTTLNRNAVNEISASFADGSYIPNTITLNMPEATEFYYDAASKELVIKNMEMFDILDGFHRYIAMSNIYNENPDFDYPVEIRIVCFATEKAKQFIFQEDQKTKMTKVDSDSMNQRASGNQVVSMLSQSGAFAGKIKTSDYSINSAMISSVIGLLFFQQKRKFTRAEMVAVKNIYVKRLNELADAYPEMVDTKWSGRFAIIFFAVVGFDHENSEHRAIEEIYTIAKTLTEDKTLVVSERNITTHIITRIRKAYGSYASRVDGGAL